MSDELLDKQDGQAALGELGDDLAVPLGRFFLLARHFLGDRQLQHGVGCFGAGRMVLDQPIRDLVAPLPPVDLGVEAGQGTGGAEAAVLPFVGFQLGVQQGRGLGGGLLCAGSGEEDGDDRAEQRCTKKIAHVHLSLTQIDAAAAMTRDRSADIFIGNPSRPSADAPKAAPRCVTISAG